MGKQSRGWEGAVLKALGAPDFQLTVTGNVAVTPHYLRLSFTGGGLLTGRTVHPTMWIRLWFFNGKRMHQRAYTVTNADCGADTFDLEFAMHDGPAADWARTARAGDTTTATVMGSKFDVPQPAPNGLIVVGDTASLPAINTLLAATNDIPARVWLEWQHADDVRLPVARQDNAEVTWVRREGAGRLLADTVARAAFDATGHFGWVACDMKTTRAVVRILRDRYGLDRKAIKAQAYWM